MFHPRFIDTDEIYNISVAESVLSFSKDDTFKPSNEQIEIMKKSNEIIITAVKMNKEQALHTMMFILGSSSLNSKLKSAVLLPFDNQYIYFEGVKEKDLRDIFCEEDFTIVTINLKQFLAKFLNTRFYHYIEKSHIFGRIYSLPYKGDACEIIYFNFAKKKALIRLKARLNLEQLGFTTDTPVFISDDFIKKFDPSEGILRLDEFLSTKTIMKRVFGNVFHCGLMYTLVGIRNIDFNCFIPPEEKKIFISREKPEPNYPPNVPCYSQILMNRIKNRIENNIILESRDMTAREKTQHTSHLFQKPSVKSSESNIDHKKFDEVSSKIKLHQHSKSSEEEELMKHEMGLLGDEEQKKNEAKTIEEQTEKPSNTVKESESEKSKKEMEKERKGAEETEAKIKDLTQKKAEQPQNMAQLVGNMMKSYMAPNAGPYLIASPNSSIAPSSSLNMQSFQPQQTVQSAKPLQSAAPKQKPKPLESQTVYEILNQDPRKPAKEKTVEIKKREESDKNRKKEEGAEERRKRISNLRAQIAMKMKEIAPREGIRLYDLVQLDVGPVGAVISIDNGYATVLSPLNAIMPASLSILKRIYDDGNVKDIKGRRILPGDVVKVATKELKNTKVYVVHIHGGQLFGTYKKDGTRSARFFTSNTVQLVEDDLGKVIK